MSDRERWIVYPLLFFAIAIGWNCSTATRGRAHFKSINCESIEIRSPSDQTRIRLVGREESGSISIYGNNGLQLAVITSDHQGQAGSLVLHSPASHSQVTIQAGPDGGQLRLQSTPTKPEIVLGFDPKSTAAGLSAFEPTNVPCAAIHSSDGVWFLTAAAKQANVLPGNTNRGSQADQPAGK